MKTLLHASPSVAAAALAAVLSCQTPDAKAELPGAGTQVRPVFTTDPAAQFQLEVVLIGLERLGYELLPVQEVQVPAAYLAVAQGDADFYAQSWDPLQQESYERAGGADRLTKIGTLINDAAQGYQIDRKTAEEHQITHFEQLGDPAIARLFDFDGDGKADLVGCPPGWGCERTTEFHVGAYELGDTVTVRSGEFTPLRADVVSRYRAGESVLYYTYTPLWLNQLLVVGEDVVWLQVKDVRLPPEVMAQDPVTTIEDGTNTGWDVNRIRVVANNDFLASNPAAKRWFELVTIPLTDVNSQNLLVYEGERSVDDVKRHAREWIDANSEQVTKWLDEAAAAASQ